MTPTVFTNLWVMAYLCGLALDDVIGVAEAGVFEEAFKFRFALQHANKDRFVAGLRQISKERFHHVWALIEIIKIKNEP